MFIHERQTSVGSFGTTDTDQMKNIWKSSRFRKHLKHLWFLRKVVRGEQLDVNVSPWSLFRAVIKVRPPLFNSWSRLINNRLQGVQHNSSKWDVCCHQCVKERFKHFLTAWILDICYYHYPLYCIVFSWCWTTTSQSITYIYSNIVLKFNECTCDSLDSFHFLLLYTFYFTIFISKL